MEPSPFEPGFRVSALDIGVLAIGTASALFVAFFVDYWLGFAIAFTVAHFFLFCNVFRISRSLELTWAAIFVLMIGSTISTQEPGWLTSFGISLGATVLVVAFQIYRPSYHGVGWRKLNPQLQQWWQHERQSKIQGLD